MPNTMTAFLDSHINELNEKDFLLPESFWERNIINPMKKNHPMSTFFLNQLANASLRLTILTISPIALAIALIEMIIFMLSIVLFPLIALIYYCMIKPILSFMEWHHPEELDIGIFMPHSTGSDYPSRLPSIFSKIDNWFMSKPTTILQPQENNPSQLSPTYIAKHTAHLLYWKLLPEDFEKKRYNYNPNLVYTVDLSWAMSGLKPSMRQGLQTIIRIISNETDWNIRNLSLRGNCLAHNADARKEMKNIFQSIPTKIETLDLRDNQLSKLSLQEMESLEGTLPSIKKLYVSLDEMNKMSVEQYNAFSKIVPNSANILVFDHKNKVANHRAKHTDISQIIGLNLLAGGIVASKASSKPSSVIEKKRLRNLPIEMINHIASYLFGDNIIQYSNANKASDTLRSIFSLFYQPSLKPSSCFGRINFFSKPKPNELPLLANQQNIEP